eukprot:PhM_4_TR15670/c1_g1_i1/m.32412
MGATHFYNMRTGAIKADSLRDDIQSRLTLHGIVVLPLHTRHHWATAVITGTNVSNSNFSIFDSALSPPTQRDFALQCRRLRPGSVSFNCHARQPEADNDKTTDNDTTCIVFYWGGEEIKPIMGEFE